MNKPYDFENSNLRMLMKTDQKRTIRLYTDSKTINNNSNM